ncbi:hypothetical protein GCM10008915_74450 [Bifidobacterium pullorum subsp. gallinarum]
MILQGNNMEVMPQLEVESFNTCVTSPPYWGLRDYGLTPTYWPEVTYTPMPGLPPITVPEWTGCLGLEPTPEMFVAHRFWSSGRCGGCFERMGRSGSISGIVTLRQGYQGWVTLLSGLVILEE